MVDRIESRESKAGFRLYPNPGTGTYNLEMVLDGPGKVVLKVFDLSGSPDGIYQIRTDREFLNRLLIKE